MLSGLNRNLEAYQETQSLADHELQIDASRIIATDGILIPTGELTNVTDTYFDFRNETRLGDVIDKAMGYCGTGTPLVLREEHTQRVYGCLKQDALAWIMRGYTTVRLRRNPRFHCTALIPASSKFGLYRLRCSTLSDC
jgi:hypothetical protein